MWKKSIGCLFVSLFLLGTLIQPVMGKEKAGMPKVVSITCLGMGTVSNVLASGLGEAILAGSGIQARIEPQGTSVGRITPLRAGEGEFDFMPLFAGSEAALGWGVFERPEWGPQPLRIVWLGPNMFNGQPYVRGNSDIQSLRDMKGKKMPIIPGMTVTESIYEGLLAFANLTKADVKWIPVPSIGKILDAVLEGTVDVASSNPSAPGAFKQASSPAGIRWLQVPHKDKEGWARLFEKAPFMFPIYTEQGAGISKQNPLEGVGCPNALHAYTHLSAEVAYTVTKAIDKEHEKLKPIHAQFVDYTIDQCLDPVIADKMVTPYHEGSIKYFKEIGKWTSGLEAANQKALQLEKERMAKWKAKK
ncbi:MAG: TAXI family TRAP transporter solute-binding subunit [Pseudomonadota bacterium]